MGVAQNSSFTIQDDQFTPRQQEIIAQLQALAGNPPKALTRDDIAEANKQGNCPSLRTIRRYFNDSLRNALLAANLPTSRFITRQQAISQLRILAGQPPKVLTSSQIAKASTEGKCPSVFTLQSLFGSFTNALRTAGLPTVSKYTQEEAIRQLRTLAAKLRRNPTWDDVRDASKRKECLSSSELQNLFSSFRDALKAAGLLYTSKQKRAIRRLQALAKKLGRTPTATEVQETSSMGRFPSVGTLQNYFGSLNNALRAARLPIRMIDLPTREQALTQYLSLRNALGHTPTIAEVNSAAEKGKCTAHTTLSRLGIIRQVREERNLARGNTCAKCGRNGPIAMFLGISSDWVCRTCYPKITGKSQNKIGICPKCNKGPKEITYRDPTFGNVCESCGRGPR